MAESDVSIEVHLVDNKLVRKEHHASFSQTDSGKSTQLATKPMSINDCDYLHVISDELISGHMETATNDSECDATHSDTRSQCAQHQQYQDSNLPTRADKHIYTTVIADSDVSTQSKPISRQLIHSKR
jgi:hypothetical protein